MGKYTDRMAETVITRTELDRWAARNGVNPGTVCKYIVGQTAFPAQIAAGTAAIGKLRLLTRFIHSHPTVPSRSLRKFARQFISDQNLGESLKLENEGCQINRNGGSLAATVGAGRVQ